jgi:hypothetical protein
MQADLFIIESHPDFNSAAEQAKELAITLGESVSIKIEDNSWAVYASEEIHKFFTSQLEGGLNDIENYEAEIDGSAADDYNKEIYDEISEEIRSDQDSWARSDEDGWYYED